MSVGHMVPNVVRVLQHGLIYHAQCKTNNEDTPYLCETCLRMDVQEKNDTNNKPVIKINKNSYRH